jgi:hypothetical protein
MTKTYRSLENFVTPTVTGNALLEIGAAPENSGDVSE